LYTFKNSRFNLSILEDFIIILYLHAYIRFSFQLTILRDKLSHLQDEFAQLESECMTLRNMVEERDKFITTMKSEIYRKEYKSDTEKVELRNQLLLKEASIKKLEVRIYSQLSEGGVVKCLVELFISLYLHVFNLFSL